jgi:fido (protein-threonine AMPylation protein)
LAVRPVGRARRRRLARALRIVRPVPTEIALREWRSGHTLAERLCAGVMAIEGFTDIDPQAPIGGPDGKKDILAMRSGLRWLAAVFFAATHQSFAEVRAKFEADLAGVGTNAAEAFAFFVNQPLTLGERADLVAISSVPTEIYHLERLRAILDAPLGYGLRVEYLNIPMTAEEQASFVLALEGTKAQLLAAQAQLARAHEVNEAVLERTMVVGGPAPTTSSSITTDIERPDLGDAPLAALTVELLLFIHRLVAPDSLVPEPLASQLRVVPVAVGDPEAPAFAPPAPSQVPQLVRDYVDWWRGLYPQLRQADPDIVIAGLAELHHRFVSIHPFYDGNGRVARALLDQAARELLSRGVGPRLTAEPEAYFSALREADSGNLAPLRELIDGSLT